MIFIKGRIMILLRISTLLKHVEKCQGVPMAEQGLYSVRNAPSPGHSHPTMGSHLSHGASPGNACRDVGLPVLLPLALLWGAWTADSHGPFLPSAALCEQHLIRRWGKGSINRSGGRGAENTSRCQSVTAMKGCVERRPRRGGALLHWTAGSGVPHTAWHPAGRKASITALAPGNWFFPGSALIRNHSVILLLQVSHYFWVNGRKTRPVICCS